MIRVACRVATSEEASTTHDIVNADRLLTTTRSVRRRLDFDRPVPAALIEECLTVALQAPTGGNLQVWRFVVVTDPDKRAAIADVYRRAWDVYRESSATMYSFRDDDPRAAREPTGDGLVAVPGRPPRAGAGVPRPVRDGPRRRHAALPHGHDAGVRPAGRVVVHAGRPRAARHVPDDAHADARAGGRGDPRHPGRRVTGRADPRRLLHRRHVPRVERLPMERIVSWDSWGQAAPPR